MGKRTKSEETNNDNVTSFGEASGSYVRKVKARTENQSVLMEALEEYTIVLALGPAGTGKTYLALNAALEALKAGHVGRLILTRPAIEAGEELGYLPGDMIEKLDPYLRPLYDILIERIGGKNLKTHMANGIIEIAPIAFMRGRTLNNSFILIDEAQNCTKNQLKMLLTRLGEGSQMVLTGDPDQNDLPPDTSGLDEIAYRLQGLKDVGVVHLTNKDIVRHPLIADVLEALQNDGHMLPNFK